MKKYTSLLLISLCIVVGLSTTTTASHLVGGDLSYECLGNNQYRITLNVYKDCFASGQNVADFDDPAYISIFQGSSTAAFTTLSIPFTNIRDTIDIDLSNPCLTPPNNVCVSTTVYSDIVTLPYNPAGYHVAYRRCCRNQTINNIPNPGTWGTTMTIFISDLAQTSCNNSPTFDNFPPIVICTNQPVNFDHGATDTEGDSLVYSFCAPFHGASQNDPWPSFALAPPYTQVPFNTPTYSAGAPLGGNPVVTINPQTGFITGNPTITGQFVVGVCVDEYRNGVWLSTTKRDFQFNVVDCIVSLDAEIVADVNVDGRNFIYNRCGDSTITMPNISTQAQNITGYLWEFNMNGNIVNSVSQDATFTFPGYGTYQGTMQVNPGSVGCTDTAFITVNIFPSANIDFDFSYDTCNIGPVTFIDQSSVNPGGGTLTNWDWDYGDDSTDIIRSPVYQYAEAGDFDVKLKVTDSNGCVDSLTQTITWAPASIIDIVPDAVWGCNPETITFENNSYPQNGYSTIWTLGDGNISTDASPTHTYDEPGVYDVTITIVSPLNCVSQDTFPNLITIYPAPTPSFTTAYDSCEYGPVTFTDFSTEGGGPILEWRWLFDNGDTLVNLDNQTVVYQYDSAGNFDTRLQIIDVNGCVEEATQPVSWFPAPVIQVSQSEYLGCVPYNLQIVNTSFPINGYFTLWDLGDGFYSDKASPIHTYEEPGSYDLKFSVVSPTGCAGEQVFPNLVVVSDNPQADFDFTPELPSNFNPTVDFFDRSVDAVEWEWDFGTGATSTEQNPTYTFPDTGNFNIRLVATNSTGCTDTTTYTIDILPNYTYFLPNAFTPNDDAVNDGYRGRGELFGISDFRMSIWNRWGEKIFETNDPLQSWNGRVNNSGKLVKAGVYVVTVTFTGPRGEREEFKEFATVIR